MSLIFVSRALDVSKAVHTIGVDPSELGLPAQWKKVALVYAGHHYRIGGPPWPAILNPSPIDPKLKRGRKGTTDWRVAKDNHNKLIIGPLAERGVSVDVYFHTWPSHRPIEAELVEHYKPVNYSIASRSSHDSPGVDSRVEALKLIADLEIYDAIVMTRFEIILNRSLDTFPIQPHKVNVPFREISQRRRCYTSDLMYIFPPRYVDSFINRSWIMGHGLIESIPLADKANVGVDGCPPWQEHVHLMSDEFARSGDSVNPIGFVSRDLTTVEEGPYYDYTNSYCQGCGNGHDMKIGRSPLPMA
jgi:hypothetical protein